MSFRAKLPQTHVRRAVACTLWIAAAGAALAQTADFYESQLSEGRAEFAKQRFVEAADKFRIASFGLLSRPELLSEALARLALAEEAASRSAEADAALSRFVETERQFESYRPERLEGNLAPAFRALLTRRVPRDRLMGVPSLAALVTGRPYQRRPVPTPVPAPPPAPPPVREPVPPSAPMFASPTATQAALEPTQPPTFTPWPTSPPLPPATPTPPATAIRPAPPTRTPSAIPPTRIPSPTATPRPPTATRAPTLTATQPPPTPTATFRPPTATRAPTLTATQPPPTPTATFRPPTATRVPTLTATQPPPTPTATFRPPTATRVPTLTATQPLPTRTATLYPPTATATPTRVASSTRTAVPPTMTPTVTRTVPFPTAIPTRRPFATAPTPTAGSLARRTPIPTSGAPRPGTYVHSDDVDTPPRIKETVNPVYPPDALRARVRGLVILAVLVSETGAPLEVRVIQRAREGLTEAAIAAVRRWRFEPAEKRGVPVTTWTTVRIPFEAIPYPLSPTAEPPPRTPGSSARRDPAPDASAPGGSTPSAASRPAATPAIAASRPAPTPATVREPSAVLRTRRAVRLAVSPDQARVFVNGAYVGIADDWDGHGGGLDYQFASRGGNLVHLELPGYDNLDLEVVVTAAADEEVLEIDADLERRRREPYRRLPSVVASTTGAVVFDAEPDVLVSAGGRALGPASRFTRQNPLTLAGPATHEFVFTSPAGGEPRAARVLVAPQAAEDVAVVRVRLRR